MKILLIIGCIECRYRQLVYGGYYCRNAQKHIEDMEHGYPEWCPLEDYKPKNEDNWLQNLLGHNS